MTNLNVTQRQMCEKIAQLMNKNNAKAYGFQGFLSAIAMIDENEVLSMPAQELIDYGVIDKQLHLASITWTSDPIIRNAVLESKSMYIHHENDQYTNTREWHTIMDSFAGYPNLASAMTTPIMDKVRTSGFSTLAAYSRSIFNYGTTGLSTDIIIYIGDEKIKICTIAIADDNVVVSDVNPELQNVIQSLSVIVAGTSMIYDICSALSNGIHNPSDLSAIIGHYVNSNCASISSFARDVLKSGRDSLSTTLNNIIQMFRDNFTDYHENEDGTITWNIETHPVSCNFWAVAGNIIVGGVQTLGTILLFSGAIVAKIVGGLLFIGASIVQAITQTIGTLTGTTPYVNDEAIDQCYHDPIAQQNKLQLVKNQLHPDLVDMIVNYGRVKILADCCTIYLYNFKDLGSHYQCDAKVFANLTAPAPGIKSCIWFNNPNWPDCRIKEDGPSHAVLSRWREGFFSICIQPGLNPDRGWFFSFDGNNGLITNYDPTGEGSVTTDQHDPDNLRHFVTRCLELSNSANGVSITSKSADAGDWTTLWDVLRVNVIQTLTYVFCNPLFYANEDNPMAVNHHEPHGYSLNNLMYYGMYDGAPGYAALMNDIIGLANMDHDGDMFMVSLLNTLGLNILITAPRTYQERVMYAVPRSAEPHTPDFTNKIVELNISNGESKYLNDYIGIFPFLAIDPYSYVTPPTTDYKSIIWGAIIATAIVATVIVGIKVAKTMIRRRIENRMLGEGKKLSEEGKSMKQVFTPEQFKELNHNEQKEYLKAYRKYNFKVNIYNAIAKCLGLNTYDWRNDWWNDPSGAVLVPQVSDIAVPDTIAALSDIVTDPGSIGNYELNREDYEEHPTDALILYRILTGRNPNSN